MRIIIEKPKRVVFMGTPEFAVPPLRALVEHAPPAKLWATGLDIVGVVTRPDKPSGRGRQVVASPVKQFAAKHGIPVYQPGPLRRPEALKLLETLDPEVIIVAAFGQILPPEVLELPRHCCLNVHASLLPRWRGAAPIAAAILAGDADTGVTIMQMEEGLDTGPIIAQRATPIGASETAGELTDRLAELGARLLVEMLPYWLADGASTREQDETQATMTRPLKKGDGRLDWSQSADELGRQVRAYSPWPGAFTTWKGARVKLLQAHAVPAKEHGASGTSRRAANDGVAWLEVACGQGALALDVIQLEGKRALPIGDVLRGHPALADAVFGT
ncbi:MAG TPA: methionyl-tRNA formyltransferase [Ktedonobacterales bacterium]|nr:methionyl-tRNA formyltransferase [Ktedonobacterales bacterium]